MKHSYHSQSEPQYNPLSDASRHLLDVKASTGASPLLARSYSQRSVGNGTSLQQRGNNSGRSNQLSMATMSQLGGMTQSQQQFYSNRPLSSGYTPGASQPALSGVFKPGSAPQRPSSSQLDVQTASQWTQPAVTSSLGGQGYARNNSGSLLQHLPATNQPMLRPKQVALLRTSAAAPQMQGRPGSAPGLLSGATAAASPAQTLKQPYLQPPALLQQSQHPFSSSHQQQQPHYRLSSQGGLSYAPGLLGSQQQQHPLDLATVPPTQEGLSRGIMLDDGSAGTGVTMAAEPAAEVLADPAADQQQQLGATGPTTTAATDRLGPRMRELLEDLPPLHQQPQQCDTLTADTAAASNPEEAASAKVAAELRHPAQPSTTPQEPAAATAAPMLIGASGHAGSTTPAATIGVSVKPTATLPTVAPVPAVDPELVLKRISRMEDYCSSMNSIVLRDIPLLLQQADSTSMQITALAANSSSNHAALESRMQKVSTAVASFMDVLKVWQQEQQQHIQQLQEQAAKQAPQQVLSHAACQTSPGLMVTKQSSAAPAAVCAAGAGAVIGYQDAPASMRASGHATLPTAAAAVGRGSAAPTTILSPLRNRHNRNAAANQQTSAGPSAAVQAVAAAITVDGQQAANDAAGEDKGEPGEPAAGQWRSKQTSRQPKGKPANRPMKEPAAQPQGTKRPTRAKAAAAQAQEEAAAAVNALKLQPAAAAHIAASGGSGKAGNSCLVQSKLNFTRRVTRSSAAKGAAVAQPDTAAGAAAATAPVDLAATQTSKQSPAAGGTAHLYLSMDGAVAAALATGARSNPGASKLEGDSAAWIMGDKTSLQSSKSLPQRKTGSTMHNVSQQGDNLRVSAAAAASGTAAAGSGAGRASQRHTTPEFTHGSRAAEATAGARIFAGSRPGPLMDHNQYAASPDASPPSLETVTVPATAPLGQTAQPHAKLSTNVTPGTPSLPPAAGAAAAVAGAKRGKPASAAAVAGSGLGKQAAARWPPAAGSGVGTTAQAAAKPTGSGAGSLFNRPTSTSQNHQQPRGQINGSTSRLLGMKRNRPRPAAAAPALAAAAPARSAVLMLFGDMDSDSTDCGLEEDNQHHVVTGPRCREAATGAQQSAYAVATGSAAATLHPASRGLGAPGAEGLAGGDADVILPAAAILDSYQTDEHDIARQVAARMAQHRRKHRRIAGGGLQ